MRVWCPYAVLISLVVVGVWMPPIALFVLAVIHFAALDSIRRQPDPARPVSTWQDRLGQSIADQITSVEFGHRFSGDDLNVTSTAHYTGHGRTFVVAVTRKHETEDAA